MLKLGKSISSIILRGDNREGIQSWYSTLTNPMEANMGQTREFITLATKPPFEISY